MSEKPWPTWACSYGYRGSEWSFTIKAPDREDAERRLKLIGANGRVDGELMLIIPVPGFVERLLAFFRGRNKQKDEK